MCARRPSSPCLIKRLLIVGIFRLGSLLGSLRGPPLRAPRESTSQKPMPRHVSGGIWSPLEALDAVAAPLERWLRARKPSSPEREALACKQSGPITGGAWRSHRGRAGDCADPSRTPGRSVPLGLAPPRHPFVGCRRSVKRAASLPKSRCAPHRESPRRAARPDGSSTGRQLRTRHKNSDTHGQLHGQPWPTTACASTRG